MADTYIIVSPRLGVPGEIWIANELYNVDALLAGGFIRRASDQDPAPATPKATRVKTKTKPDTEPTE